MRRGLIILVLLALPAISWAKQTASGNCWVDAGQRYGVSPHLLYGIARVESGLNPNARERLSGSESVGLMQINSVWYGQLRQYGIRREDLWEPCTNIHVGAWVLAHCIGKYGNTWTAIGCYNAGDINRNNARRKIDLYIAYAKKVYAKLYAPGSPR